MFIVLLKLILLTSIWVLGLTIVTQEGMLLYNIRLWAEKKADEGNRWVEPLILCHWCMSSLHSFFGYAFALVSGIVIYDWHILILYPLVVMGSSIVNGLTWAAYQLVSAKTEFYKNINDSNYGNEKEGSSEESGTEKSSHENY